MYNRTFKRFQLFILEQLFICFCLFNVNKCTPINSTVTFDKFLEDIKNNNCSFPDKLVLPFKSYLEIPLSICKAPETSKRAREAVNLCSNIFDNLKNFTCDSYKHSQVTEMKVEFSDDVCADISFLTFPSVEDKHLLRQLTDKYVCDMLCDDEFKPACQVLLWSYEVQQKIENSKSYFEFYSLLDLLTKFNQEVPSKSSPISKSYPLCHYLNTPMIKGEEIFGDLLDDNSTVRCVEPTHSCYIFWQEDTYNKTIKIVNQGCWIYDQKCHQNKCSISNGEISRTAPKMRFCCCVGNFCNADFTDNNSSTDPFAEHDDEDGFYAVPSSKKTAESDVVKILVSVDNKDESSNYIYQQRTKNLPEPNLEQLYPAQENGLFVSTFLIIIFVLMAGILIFQNKQKIMAHCRRTS